MSTSALDQKQKTAEPSSPQSGAALPQFGISSSARSQSAELMFKGGMSTGAQAESTAQQGFEGSGGTLPFRAEMEQTFGTDLGGVRAHTGPAARQANQILQADAYTLGQDMAFGEANPSAPLVAHELTHAIQQGAAGTEAVAPKSQRLSSSAAEAQALAVEQAVQTGAPVAPLLGGLAAPEVMRSELHEDSTQLADVRTAGDLKETSAPGATILGALSVGDTLRILDRPGGHMRVHVERGALRGQVGYFPQANVQNQAGATSLRSPSAGPEDMYAHMATSAAANDRDETIGGFHLLTNTQRRQLLTVGDPTWAAVMAAASVTGDDVINMLNVLGARLNRKLRDYLSKNGSTYAKLRLAFASAQDDERMEVARDDALVGQLRPNLGQIHPEIIFGTILSDLYPADGDLNAFAGTNPQLGAWLQARTRAGTDINDAADERAAGIQGALTTLQASPDGNSYRAALATIYAAPRGLALVQAERDALDQVEEIAFNMSRCSPQDMGVMFVTRWGRPMEGAASTSKTLMHQIWGALKQLPDAHSIMSNVVNYYAEEQDPGNLGSFGFWMFNRPGHGALNSKDSAQDPGVLHAAVAKSGRNIPVQEQNMELLQVGEAVEVSQADGSTGYADITWLNSSSKTLGLNTRVTVNVGSEIRGGDWAQAGDAQRVTQRVDLYAEDPTTGDPDPATVLGSLEPGIIYVKMADASMAVAGKTYHLIHVNEGAHRRAIGWIEDNPAAESALGGTMAQENFAWTVRHEMGHALDLQIGGFSAFSEKSSAKWKMMTGSLQWVNQVISSAGVANAGTAVNRAGVNLSFQDAAQSYIGAVQSGTTGSDANAINAKLWLDDWLANGGQQATFDTVTQFEADGWYYNQPLPALGGQVFTAHYGEYFQFDPQARTESLAVGIPPYAYCCPLEFFAEHYAAYTGPGVGAERFARAVPQWALNFFDRTVGRAGAGPEVGPES